MAKKIIVTEVTSASNALKDFQIEHVVVTHYEDFHGDKVAKRFIIVLNKDAEEALTAINASGAAILKVKGFRHFEKYATSHPHYQPKFRNKCRCCGKTFESTVKEAVWCSPKCKSDFRKAKKLL